MLAGWEEEAARQSQQSTEPQRVLLATAEYPGTAPGRAEVAQAEQLRQEGNAAYADGRFEEAIRLYSNAAVLNPSDHLVYSNRSTCLLRMGRPVEALDDADLCVSLAPDFARGFLRKGAAEQMLNRRVDAQASYKRGLGHDPESAALLQALRGLRAESGGGLQATLYHVLFVSPHLQMDRLFQVLEDPDRLTATYVEEHKTELDAQFACLTQTLRVDLGLLLASPVLRDAYDRVTFACGQLLQWAPEAVSKNLVQARRIVEGLGLALRCGWSIHHGVAKFSANALTILATSEGAADELRREATRLLLGGLLRWLLDPTPEPENPPEDRDVCGCTFLSPRLSAATWLERLFEHGTRKWVREECEKFPSMVLLAVHLCLVVRDERAVPLGLPCLLRLPAVARAAMECEAVVDLATCNRDAMGRRDGRRWLARQRGKAGGGAGAGSGTSASGGRSAGAGAGASPPSPSITSPATPPEVVDGSSASANPSTQSLLARTQAPSQRLGEWLMASLGYLLVFVDDDALFAAHACSALFRLAHAVPDGVARLTEGVWMGLPMLERLSMLACQHTAALELLETLARHSPQARAAMRSLAASLAASAPAGGAAQPVTSPALPAAIANAAVATAADTSAPGSSDGGGIGEGGEKGKGLPLQDNARPPLSSQVAAVKDVKRGDAAASSASASSAESSGPAPRATAQEDSEREQRDPEHEHEQEGLGEPSWVECYHELHDELWIRSESDPGMLPPSKATNSGAPERPTPLPFHGVVSLGNFPDAAPQVPFAGRLVVVSPTESKEPSEALAVPAVWNQRFDDLVEARLEMDEPHIDLGTLEWQTGKEGSIVLILRSAIQRSPATPDWAASVWLSAEAGALAAVVVNDLPDDGPVQPAFRMGLFGAPAPPIPAFMVGGRDGETLRAAAKALAPARVHVAVRSIRTGGVPILPRTAGTASDDDPVPPPWPLVLRVPQDVAQAWSLVETVYRAAPSAELAAALDALAQRMGLPEKRIWLTRRLQRYHRGDTDSDEPVEPQLAFVECDREGDQLQQLRKQFAEKTGLAAADITGEFEVRFREESSVGSAVVREWMDILAQQAFLPAAHRLLISYDGGVSFLPDPAAPFLNPQWNNDFEMLGRLLGLALWHQVTLDLPVHPYVCELLLRFGSEGADAGDEDQRESDEATTGSLCDMAHFEMDSEKLKGIDPELYRHKVQWLLANNVSDLGYEMPFLDVLIDGGAPPAEASKQQPASSAAASQLPALPEVVAPKDALPGDERAVEPLRLRAWQPSGAQVELVPGGEDMEVTEANKSTFAEKLLDWRLRGSLQGPLVAMVRGLRAVVPATVLAEARRMLSPSEVHGLLAGMRDIDVDNWEKNTRLAGGLTASSQEVRWFWQIVKEWAAEGRQDRLQDLLQFATGSRRVPVGGFAQLVGFNGGKHLFTLARGVHLSANSLPTSHACICTVDLPPWESLEAAKHKLLAASEVGRARFDEGPAAAATRGNEDE